jgi:predicted MPP superfamily phosphohydrolase
MNRRLFIKSMLATGFSFIFGGTAYAYRSMELEITHEKIRIEGVEEKMRIVALSDLHAPCFYFPDDTLVETVNRLRPDVFILAGDIVDRYGNENLVSVFENVKSRFAKLAVYGNWEYHGGLDQAALLKSYEKAGVTVLVNDVFQLKGMTFVGLDDYLRGKPDYQLLRKTDSKISPVLAVAHCPASFDRFDAGSRSPLITLSGHTHGGQIAPFGRALITPHGSSGYVHGWYHRKNQAMYVMRGVGTSVVPVRIGAKPEILVLDLENG